MVILCWTLTMVQTQKPHIYSPAIEYKPSFGCKHNIAQSSRTKTKTWSHENTQRWSSPPLYDGPLCSCLIPNNVNLSAWAATACSLFICEACVSNSRTVRVLPTASKAQMDSRWVMGFRTASMPPSLPADVITQATPTAWLLANQALLYSMH